MPLMEHLLHANELYSASFRMGRLPRTPRLQLAILTCMDSRIDPDRILGLQEGDAHVIRNAGGRASDDAIRSLVISYRLLGTREFLVVHHTDCGMQRISNDRMHQDLLTDLGADVSDVDFLPISDPDETVRSDVDAIRTSSMVRPDINIHGFVYDVLTGRLREVV
ncbi:MAG: carbonic anhydrase [Chloroflexota bacterium]|nr:carbonic anhydrase [Chloroflexota bacterium]